MNVCVILATKIEFYVGDVPYGHTPSLQNARYTRLGYVDVSLINCGLFPSLHSP